MGDGKKVALTFDDGPAVNISPRILDILKAHDIKATFFIHGERVNFARTAKRIAPYQRPTAPRSPECPGVLAMDQH